MPLDGTRSAMNSIQAVTDKTAIGLSLICALHCLVLPLMVILLPSAVALRVEDEAFHYWMVVAVVPLSLYALTLGCKTHRRYPIALVGVSGLLVLCSTVILGHELLGDTGEKALTLLGASLVASGHFWNYRRCSEQVKCECSESADQ